MVINAGTRWGPSLHRFGQKFDHGLLSATWRWKTKKTTRFETADFKAMDSQSWRSFDRDLRIRTQELEETRVVEHGHNGHALLNAAKEREEETAFLNVTKLKEEMSVELETIKVVVPTK